MKVDVDTNDVKLTAKEEKFCYQYVLHLNAAKAATNAGYSEHSARITGCRLLTKTNIQKGFSETQVKNTTNIAERRTDGDI